MLTLVHLAFASAAGASTNCGDGIVEGGEECDPGGPKFNESPEGQFCSTSVDCSDGGSCVSGHCRCTTNSQCGTNVCATGADGFGHCTCTTGNACFFAGSGGCCKFNCQAVGSGNGCDDGNACSIGEQCNNVGACTCTGSCNPTAGVGSVCRSSTGECDVAEICLAGTGCPADTKSPAGTPCTDDGIVCTADQCNGSSALCQHPPGNAGVVCRASTGECDPAETCTGSSSTCPSPQPPTGTPCTDDGNACTSDVCDSNSSCTHPNNTAPCSDGLFCDGNDTCSNGSCSVHSGNPCASLGECNNGTCNEGSDNCAVAAGAGCSSDGNVCTDDICDGAGGCVHVNNTAPCNDGLACNGADTCHNGTCSVHAGDPCAGGSECNNTCNPDGSCHAPAGIACSDDGNVCTNDQCDGSGVCGHPANTAPCNDGLFCTGTDTCSGGACAAHSGNPCSGGAECNNVCNEAARSCAVSAGTACTDDLNICTDDQCNGSGACIHPNNIAPCNDGVFCNGDQDTCSGGSCSAHIGNPCTVGPECNNQCNELANNCFASAEAVCTDDGNVCTNDHCDGSGACAHPNNTAPCDDGLFCDGADICSEGACGHSGDPCSGGSECAATCNESADNCFDQAGTACTGDGNVCTDDTCNGSGSCAHPNNTAGCEDGLFCTVNEVCSGGSCGAGVARDCSNPSSDICTIDSCSEQLRTCVNTPDPGKNGTACNDHDACTEATTCSAGLCVNGTPLNCDDGNGCTTDSCDTATGCVNLTTVESRVCDSCEDGIDNDTDQKTDMEDSGCSTLWREQRFALTSSSTVGSRSKRLFLGGDVHVDSTAGTVLGDTTPYPRGASRAGVCGNDMKILAGVTCGLFETQYLSTEQRGSEFGLGEVGEKVISFREEYGSNGGPESMRGSAPLVGPGICSDDASVCAQGTDVCASAGNLCCTGVGAVCTGQRTLSDSGNPYVDRSGASANFLGCQTALISQAPDGAGVATLTANVPGYLAADAANIKLSANGAGKAISVGGGLQVLDVGTVKLSGYTELQLLGQDDTVLVIRVKRKLVSGGGGKVTLGSNGQGLGSLRADHVLWNVEGTRGGKVTLKRASVFKGTILAPERKCVIGGAVDFEGAALCSVMFNGATRILHAPFTPCLTALPQDDCTLP